MSDYQDPIVEQFRANHGKVGGYFEGADLLILHTVGAKTGETRLNPMMYRKVGDRYMVFASKGGAPENPGWYHNLLANPNVEIEVGDETIAVTAEPVVGDERDDIYNAHAEQYPTFADYEKKTTRTIPVVALSPAG